MSDKETAEFQPTKEEAEKARAARYRAQLDAIVKAGKARTPAHANFKIRCGVIPAP